MDMRVLVVDDNQDVLHLLEIKLGKDGYNVLTAKDGEQGLLLAQEQTPDVVLLETMLPVLGGLALVRRLKSEVSPVPVVILLTSKSSEEDIRAGFSAGADDFISKPFSPRVLEERISVNLIKAGQYSAAEVEV